MKQLFVFLGVACAMVGTGLVVPRPALAISPDCPVVFQGPYENNFLTIYQIDEINGPFVRPEGNRCIIAPQILTHHLDILEQGQNLDNPSGPTPVSDYVDFIISSGITDVELQSDLAGETGLRNICFTRNDGNGACRRLLEDANGIAQDPQNTTVNTPYGHIFCSVGVGFGIGCLNIVSDAENAEAAVPEPTSALLLGTMLPGLFGFRRLSRRDR